MKTITRLALTAAAFITPVVAVAQTTIGGSVSSTGGFLGISWGTGGAMCTNNLCSIANTFLYLINNVLVPLLFAIAFIVFLYGVFKKYIWSKGDAGAVDEGHMLILWGIIGFVIMISIWGLVNVVANTFGLAGYSAPRTPTSYPTP
ncbi:MAG: hypothetical protein JWN18_688 [Parcubacteria group bacterium]|nr:hypothetical protein [Parcubacteria group bacterium]